MSASPTIFRKILNEQSVGLYSVSLIDDIGVPIGSGRINSLILTLCNKVDGVEINGRTDQDVLNANNVTVSAGGDLVYFMQGLDAIIVDSALPFETHLATFKMVFDSTKTWNWDFFIEVRNLTKVS